ncbi:MAG TPA: hypothetical protein VMB03_04155 [Bryobacteraceae bacterium]|nr:hypothetical protein [Bryobacteraceae bacterium]
MIELNGDQIIDRVAAQLRREPEISHGKAIQDCELRALGQDLLQHLGDWLSAGNGSDLSRRYEQLGKICFEQGVPLHEALRGMSLLREKMLDVAQEHMISNSSIELYAEEELERRLGRFFDRLAMQMARGFEEAVREPLAAGRTIH